MLCCSLSAPAVCGSYAPGLTTRSSCRSSAPGRWPSVRHQPPQDAPWPLSRTRGSACWSRMYPHSPLEKEASVGRPTSVSVPALSKLNSPRASAVCRDGATPARLEGGKQDLTTPEPSRIIGYHETHRPWLSEAVLETVGRQGCPAHGWATINPVNYSLALLEACDPVCVPGSSGPAVFCSRSRATGHKSLRKEPHAIPGRPGNPVGIPHQRLSELAVCNESGDQVSGQP